MKSVAGDFKRSVKSARFATLFSVLRYIKDGCMLSSNNCVVLAKENGYVSAQNCQNCVIYALLHMQIHLIRVVKYNDKKWGSYFVFINRRLPKCVKIPVSSNVYYINLISKSICLF